MINYTGVTKEDLGFEEESNFHDFVNLLIFTASDYVETYIGKKFETPPEGLSNIVTRITSNLLRNAILNRQQGIIEVNDVKTIIIDDTVLTEDIRRDLELFRDKTKIKFLIPLKD